MNTLMRRAAITTSAVVSAVAIASCGLLPGGGDGVTSGDDYSVKGALSELPRLPQNSDRRLLVLTADVRAAEEAQGLQRPAGMDGDWTRSWLMPLTNSPEALVHVPYPGWPGDRSWTQLTKKAYGFDVLDVDSFAAADATPQQFVVVQGERLGEDSLPDSLTALDDGLVTDRAAKDLTMDLGHSSAANQLGRPTRLAARDEHIAASTSTPAAAAWKRQDADETLADDSGLLAVAEQLDDVHVISATLSKGPFSADGVLGKKMPSAAVAKLRDQSVPQSFDTVGIGWAASDGRAEMIVVYHFADSGAASDAADPLEKLWRDGTSVRTRSRFSDYVRVRSVKADHETVTVSLERGPKGRAQVLQKMLLSGELTFAHR